MFELYIYFVALLMMLIYCIARRSSPLAIVLMILYCVIGGFAIKAANLGLVDISQVKIFPFIFLVIVYAIFINPFFLSRNKINSSKVNMNIETFDERYCLILYVYVLCTIVYLIAFAPQSLAIYKMGNWRQNYDSQLMAAEGPAFNYRNRIEWFATQVSNYTGLLSVIISFLYLRGKKHIKLAYSCIALFLFGKICSAMYVSSRGVLFQIMFLMIGLLAFVFPEIKKSTKAIIAIAGICAFYILIPYIAQVTISRFSSNYAINSVIRYLGLPPTVFNTSVWTIDRFSYGIYAFGTLFNIPFDQYAVGGSWGASFYTFVGWIYIDWGPIGTILVGFVLSFIMRQIIIKDEYKVSDLLIIFYYYQFLVMGSLVIGRSQNISIIMVLVLYFIVRFVVENPQIKIKMNERKMEK